MPGRTSRGARNSNGPSQLAFLQRACPFSGARNGHGHAREAAQCCGDEARRPASRRGRARGGTRDPRHVAREVAFLSAAPVRAPCERASKELKRRGFKFVGPTIVHAWMQAVGIVN
ncbi:MAG TPA: DNA-3-methyladenine glycosylase I, partial [Polyangiaceae bacterium]